MAVTKQDILDTVQKCKDLGEEVFLKTFGFGISTRYLLLVNGATYPSKAILGVAVGKTAKNFSGGVAFTVRILKRLGFKIIEKVTKKIKEFIQVAVKAVVPFTSIALSKLNLPTNPASIFSSGCANEGELAFSHVGYDIGISASKCSKPFEDALREQLVGTGVQLFVDSGAFSEIKFDPAPRVVKPMSDKDWHKIIDLYYRLASYFGDQIHVVAPDRVADQAVTLERMKTYSDYMVGLLYMGARVLVPVQRGNISQVDFFYEACKALEVKPEDVMPALPCKKGATTEDELRTFVQAVQPKHLHLLGMGARSLLAVPFLSVIARHSPHTLVQLDSCIMRSQVGRKKRLGRWTYSQDYAVEHAGIDYSNVPDKKALGILMAFGDYCQFKPDGKMQPIVNNNPNLLVLCDKEHKKNEQIIS